MDPAGSDPIDIPMLTDLRQNRAQTSSPFLLQALSLPNREGKASPEHRRRFGVARSFSPRSPRYTTKDIDVARVLVITHLGEANMSRALCLLFTQLSSTVRDLEQEGGSELLARKAEALTLRIGRQVCLDSTGGSIMLSGPCGKVIATAAKINLSKISWRLKDFERIAQCLKGIQRRGLRDSTSVEVLGTQYYADANSLRAVLGRQRAPVTVQITINQAGACAVAVDQKPVKTPVSISCDLAAHVSRWWGRLKAKYWNPKLANSCDVNLYSAAVNKAIAMTQRSLAAARSLDNGKFIAQWPQLFTSIARFFDLAQQVVFYHEGDLPILRTDRHAWISRRLPPGADLAPTPHPFWCLEQREAGLLEVVERHPGTVPICFHERRPHYLSFDMARMLIRLFAPDDQLKDLPEEDPVRISLEGCQGRLELLVLTLRRGRQFYYYPDGGINVQGL